MRYFLVSYSFNNGGGNIMFKNNRFPNNIKTKQDIEDINPSIDMAGLAIKTIFEFKNEQDYLDFIK